MFDYLRLDTQMQSLFLERFNRSQSYFSAKI